MAGWPDVLTALVALGASYLVAAVPFGVVVTTLAGGDQDLRTSGSGNIGGTNVARLYGWRLAALVIALDAAKGFVPVALARLAWPDSGVGWPSLVLVACFVGHCFPVYLEFRGGKGVATAAGGLLALSPLVALGAGAVWGALLAATGRSSVAALSATATAVILAAALAPDVLPTTLALLLAILLTHSSNLRRLVRGEESAVVRPVSWTRASQAHPDPRAWLDQGPTGGPPPPAWRSDD